MKWVLRIAAVVFGLPVVALCLWAGVNWLGMRADPGAVAYLRKNAHAVDLAAPRPFALDPGFLDRRVILLGEVHGISAGQTLDFALLRQLNAERGVRYYVAEIDLAQAAAFNAFLATGDEAALKGPFGFWLSQSAQWANAEFVDKLRKIRALNETLPEDRRIRFIGLDRAQDLPAMADYVAGLVAETPDVPWPGRAPLLAALTDEGARRAFSPDGAIPLAAAEAAKSLPADASPELREALTRLAERTTLKSREPMIAAALTRLLDDPRYDGEQFYGLWGQFHVLDATVNGATPFARIVQQDGAPHAGEIGSISIVNIDSRMMVPAAAFGAKERYVDFPYSLDHPLFAFVTGIDDLKSARVSGTTLFRMNAEGSPYRTSNRLFVVGGLMSLMQAFRVDEGSAGRDGIVQYAILAGGSPATTPLAESDWLPAK